MAKVEVILTQHIVGLGAESDQVKVAAGFARNYLLPQGMAIPLTAANKRRLESLRQRRAEREAHELNSMTDLAKSLSKLVLILKVKTGDDGKMFGAVTPGTLADELKQQFDVSLDKRKIHLEKPLRSLGDHEVELRLHHDVNGTLKVRIESSTPPPQEEAAPAAPEGRGAGRGAEARGAARGGAKPVVPEGGDRPRRRERPPRGKAEG
jgi:large subunit ribosomal protein L9